MIFGLGDLVFGSSGGANDIIIMNDNAAITENINVISFSINDILLEGIEDVLIRIEMDFTASGGDYKEVVSPYEYGLNYNANLFISQYCAYRNTDIGSISLSDMERVLRGVKSNLYSFSRSEETRETTVYNEETGEDEPVCETWMTYTIIYNGKAHFADKIFFLSEEQKLLSQDYAQNLSIFLEDGLYQSMSQFPYNDGYRVPSAALSDERFAAMLIEAEKYLGYPYIWGGSTPEESFDCSGYVCWIINKSGVGSVGRTTAQGLYNLCAPILMESAKPGDLVFFHSTYTTADTVTHVGMYVGDNMMIHAGNPISYSYLDAGSDYWKNHFYAFGRISG
jgi:hypothetical protein